MPYTHVTLAQLRAQLAARLSDSNNIFWTEPELDEYLLESLRVYGSLTGFWRDQASFVTSAGVAFYDITSINAAFTALLGYALTDQSLLTTIQGHFLEPASSDSWAGTDQFTLDDVQNALEKRRDQFLAETGVRVTRSIQATVTGDREDLPDTLIDLRRLVWNRTSDGLNFHLWREDEWNLTAFDQTWLTPADPPIAYSVSAAPPITVQLAPPASVAGSLDLISVDSGAALDLTAGVPLGIPDDLAWVIKWGAMADLLAKSGQARDRRAQFCEERYKAGLAAARNLPTIVQANIGGVPLLVDSLNNLDSFKLNWQSETPATPDIIAVAGYNLIALSPVPDGVYTVTLDVVRKADVPTDGSDFVEIGRESLEGILSYAQHLAIFKIGGDEFDLTQWQAAEFLSQALLRNELMSAQTAGSLANMFAISRREQMDRPRRIVTTADEQ
jgi:hypothetical protein